MIVPRELPKIGGTTGGFIALIVCLSVLVLGLFITVFILLRDHLPSDEERAVRRQLSSRREQQTTAPETPNPFTYSESSTPGRTTIGQKIGGIFGMDKEKSKGSGTKKKHIRGKPSRMGQGWVQAGSGDEWETDTDVETDNATQVPQTRQKDASHGIRLMARSGSGDGIGRPLDEPFTPPQQHRYSQTESMASLVSRSPTPHRTAPTRLLTGDSISSPSSIHEAEDASVNYRSYSASPEPFQMAQGPPASDQIHTGHPAEGRTGSGGSVSVRTFHTGTKFIESLE